jgi:CDP-glycerol glycerophosphotransferase
MSVNGFVDVSKYKPGYNLLMTADILISDYSGIIFEYALLEKPIILYIYDYEKYKENRGLSVDIEKEFPFQKCKTEDELYEVISNLDYEKECEITRRFKKKYGLIEQGATENVVNEISKLLGV